MNKLSINKKESGLFCSGRISNILLNPSEATLIEVSKSKETFEAIFTMPIENVPSLSNLKVHLLGNSYSHEIPAVVHREFGKICFSIGSITIKAIPNGDKSKNYSLILFLESGLPILILNNPLVLPLFLKNSSHEFYSILHFGTKLSGKILTQLTQKYNIHSNSGLDSFDDIKCEY